MRTALAGWNVAVFCLVALPVAMTPHVVAAQEAPAPATPVAEAKPPAPRNSTGTRRFESTVTALEKTAQGVRMTLKDGTITLAVMPSTELVREERGLGVSALKLGDALSLVAFKGGRSKFSIKEKAVVSGVNPLTLKIGDVATLTVTNAEPWEFNRVAPLRMDALAVGQTVAVEMRLQRDGDISTRRVAVVVAQAKAKSPRKKASRKRAEPEDNPAPQPQ